jgi:hypothetical protein
MKKSTIIVGGIAALLSVSALFVFIFSQGERQGQDGISNSTEPNNPFPILNRPVTDSTTTAAIEPVPTDSTTGFMITTVQGTEIAVQDFLHDADVVSDAMNQGHYFLGNTFPEIVNESHPLPPYIVEYFSDTQTFNIVLLQEPIAWAREEMERYLATKLGVSASQMCALKYMVSVPEDVNSAYASMNLGFSICPDAVQL